MEQQEKVDLKKLPEELKWVERVTGLMDDSFTLPIINKRFGLDPIIGLIPGAGEVISYSISSILILAMVKHGVSGRVAIMMVGNVLIDSIIGAIPLLGDIFDFAKKANRRNLKLMQEHYEEGKHEGSVAGTLLLIFVMLILVMCLLFFIVWKAIAFLIGLF